MITIKGLVRSIDTQGFVSLYCPKLEDTVYVQVKEANLNTLREIWGRMITVDVVHSSHGFDLHHGVAVVDNVQVVTDDPKLYDSYKTAIADKKPEPCADN